MNYKNIELNWLGHSGIKIKTSDKVIYIDPFKLNKEPHELDEADFILITHSHYDHCSIEDIQKIAKNGTTIICPADVSSKLKHINKKIIIQNIDIGSQLEFEDKKIKVWAVHAYNTNKSFHTKEEDWLGYILQLGDIVIYHAGDTDNISEMSKLKNSNIDLAFLPIGGTYTMNAGEAAKAASTIKPKLAIPIHWGTINNTGTRQDAEIFLKLCANEGIDARILTLEN